MKQIADHTYLMGARKGGVGKSTLTVHLAIALAAKGKRVGILDADLYGPSLTLIEKMVGFPFGESRGQTFAERLSLSFLGSIPVNVQICKSGDLGVPFAFTENHEKLFAPLADELYIRRKNSHEKG